MDRRTNPYTPNAGAQPPALVGRDSELDDFDVLLDRVVAAYAEQSMLITGLRGVGKTVLLNRFDAMAIAKGWVTVQAEIAARSPFGPRLAEFVRKALYELSARQRWTARVGRAFAVLKSFSITINPDGGLSGSLDVAPISGLADSGHLAEDVTDLLVALGEAAADVSRGVVFLLDEVHFLQSEEMEALLTGLHRVVQQALPVTVVGAGLPQLPELAGAARSYAERLFMFRSIGRLTQEQAAAALNQPAQKLGVEFTDGAIERIYEFSEGYPYFLQALGKAAWDHAPGPQIFSTDVAVAEGRVLHQIDTGFFRVRSERLSLRELTVLRATASLGRGPHKIDAIARITPLDAPAFGDTLDELTARALLYSPRFGYVDFTVPQYDQFLRRRYPFDAGRLVLPALDGGV
jgi:hypothetical protein